MADIVLTREGGIGTLLIDRPDKRNALSRAMLESLSALLAEAADDPAIGVLVLTGGTARDFCTGADIDEFEAIHATAATVAHFTGLFANAQAAVAAFPKPVVAMISGACIGGGCGLALGCDVRIADKSARFGITPAKLGLSYSLADTRRLVDAVGLAAAADLLFTARIIDAKAALRIGLVSQVVATEDLAGTVSAWTEAVASNAGTAVANLKAMLGRVRGGAAEDDESSRSLFMSAFAGTDFAEGRRAFREKRPPNFNSTPD